MASAASAASASADGAHVAAHHDDDGDDTSHEPGREQPQRARTDALLRRVEELTTDIGSVLHANTSILFMTQQTLDQAIRALGPSPYPDGKAPTTHEVDEALQQPSAACARAVDKLLEVLAEPERGDIVDGDDIAALRGALPILVDYVELVPIAESRPSTLRTVACRIEDIAAQIPPKRLPREVVRNVLRAAREMERRVALAALLQTRSAVLQMDYTIRSFREFVTTDVRREERPVKLAVSSLLEDAHRQLASYAYSSNVAIRRKNEAPTAHVFGIERELLRAIGNLLHNAIKYSWHRDDGKPWVNVRVRRADTDVVIEFENWGVPISAQELRKGTIFELGYRGKWSTDRGRLGTGIGLTDARDIIEKHKGTLSIQSRPARSWGPEDSAHDAFYRQPFITRATLRLAEAL